MLINSIDIQNGRAVQLRRGEELVIDGGDPFLWADKFAMFGELAVIDLDAARGTGSNAELVCELARRNGCRVGGGIRDVDLARRYLNAGAASVIIGTRATPEFLRQLPRERIVVALDVTGDDVVDMGWRRQTGDSWRERLAAVAPFCSGLLMTDVRREGTLGGLDVEKAEAFAIAARMFVPGFSISFAGGADSADDIARLDAAGVDVQAGMALYSGRLKSADVALAMLRRRDADLWPTVVQSEAGEILGLVYSNAESLTTAMETGEGVYWSRRRGLWRKGATSGNTQQLIRVDLDCDRDALLFTVAQDGSGFCHSGVMSCFSSGFRPQRSLAVFAARIAASIEGARRRRRPESLTSALLSDESFLADKIREESLELIEARSPTEVCHEAADLLYFTLVRAASRGVDLGQILAELERRSRRVSRRYTPADVEVRS